WAIEPPVSRTRVAARRYARTRKASCPSSSRRSASSSSCSATSAFRGSVVATTAMIGAVPRAVVCLPTYNEAENVDAVVRALVAILGGDDRVLVIDDASPDGTGEIADRLAAEL